MTTEARAEHPAGTLPRGEGARGVSRAPELHPATSFVLLGCALLLVYGLPSPFVPVVVVVVACLAAVTSRRVRFRSWLLTVAALAGPMLVMVGVVQGLFYPGEDVTVLWEWGAASLTVEGLALAVQLWLRVTAMVSVCALLALGTDSARAFDGMIRLRLPLPIAYVCATAMSLIPLLGAQTRQALEARAARGWDTARLRTRVRLMPGVLAGLLTSSLVQLDQRHDTLTQRGYGAAPRPAPLQDRADPRWQQTLRWVAPALSLALVAASLTGVLELPTTSDLMGGLRG